MTIPYVDSTSSYIYSLSTDFGNVISPACLHKEVETALGSINFIGVFIEAGDDRVVIAFHIPLSAGDQTTLDSVVAAHDPNCILREPTDPVDISVSNDPFDGSILMYDSTSGTWINVYPEVGTLSPTDFWASLGYERTADDTLSSTTSLTFQNKISVSFYNSDSSASQIIRVGYTAEFNAANNNKTVEVEFYESVLGVQHAASAQQTNNNTNWFVFSGFHLESIPPLSTRTFNINFRIVTAGTTCSIRNSELEAWRIT